MRDPLSELFEHYVLHGKAQLGLARSLLALKTAEHSREALDAKLAKGGLDADETTQIESAWSRADDEITKLREDVGKLIQDLTGVPVSEILGANL